MTVDQQKKVISDGAIAVGNDRILGVGPAEEILGQFPEARRVITAGGKAVFPGLVNTHTHSFQSLLKGLGDDRVLSDWLAQMTFPAASHFTPELAGMASLMLSVPARQRFLTIFIRTRCPVLPMPVWQRWNRQEFAEFTGGG